MRKILLILLSCIAMSSLCLSACVVLPQGGTGEEVGLTFNEGYLDVIELGESIMADEYIDPNYSNDYTLVLTSDETDDEIDLKSRFTWTPNYPGTFTLTYTVNDGEYAGTTISTKIQVVVPEISWSYSRGTHIYRAGTSIKFSDLQASLNVAVQSYYEWSFSMDSVEYEGGKVEFDANQTSYEFPEEGTYTFNFSVTTEDGQSRSGSQKVTVRPLQVMTEEGQAWLDENNMTVHDYTEVSGDGSVSLDAGYFTNSISDGNVPYLAFNGNNGGFGEDTYVMFEFTGNNLPQLAFFCDEVTSNIADGKKGIYIHNGLTYNDGSTFSPTDSSRITLFGPDKYSSTAQCTYRPDQYGRFNSGMDGSVTAPCPASYVALNDNYRYRYIVGFTDATETSLTVKIILVNLDTCEREFDWSKKLTTISGATIDWANYSLTGSIVAYGRFGVPTKWDTVYAPFTGVNDIHELDVATTFKTGFRTTYPLDTTVNVSDYVDDQDGVYAFKVTDPDGEAVTISENGAFSYTKSGTYRLYYDSMQEGIRAASTTVDVTFDPKVDMGLDFFENYGAIVAGQFGTGLTMQTNSAYINEGNQSIRYYLNGANTEIVVGMSAKFLDFMFLARTLDSISFDVYAERDMSFKLKPVVSGISIAKQYEGTVPAETWTTITVTRELYNANWEAYNNQAWRLAISFYATEEMEDKTPIYIDNVKLNATKYAETISANAQSFLDDNGITAYAYDSINDNLQVKLQPGWYQGNHYTVKNDDVPYISYNGNYGAKSYIVMDFTGKNIPWLGFFMKKTTGSLTDRVAGVLVGTGHTKLDGSALSETDNNRVTFYGPNKVVCVNNSGMRFDDASRYSGQWGSASSASPMSINGLVDGVHYRWIIGIKSAVEGKVVLEALLLNLDTNTKVDYQTKELSDTAFTAEYLSGNIVIYGRYMKAITLDRIYPAYTNVSDIYAIDKVAEILG